MYTFDEGIADVPTPSKPLRVAAYCRVSTEHEEQECSLEAQATHFTQLIEANPDWKLVGIYTEQYSGLGTQGRSELNRLLRACARGRVDIVLCKSISRLTRNTVDALTILDGMVAKGIELRFEIEGISTRDLRIRQLFAMMAGLAQHESWSKSESIKWGLKHRADSGKAVLNHTQFLGYTKDRDGNLVIVADEAEIVRLIYSLYLSGKGYRQIKRHLEENGIKTASGKSVWSTSTIDRILSNEKYKGTLLTQKTFVKDFLDGRQVRNNGVLPQMMFEGHHEAIITPEVFGRVQEMKEQRSLK